MSVIEKIVQEIEQLSNEEKVKVLQKIQEIFFSLPQNAFVVGDNYNFWLNDKDDAYGK